MSSHLRVKETFELLRRLRNAVHESVDRERKINQEFQRRITTARHKFETSAEEEQTRLTTLLGKTETSFQTKQAALKTRHEKRRSRVGKAHRASIKQALDRIELEEGRQKYELQKNLLETERNRNNDLAANDAAYEEFCLKLAESRAVFVALEQRAESALRAYKEFQRLLCNAGEQTHPEDVSRDEYQLLNELTELHTQTNENLSRFRRFLVAGIFRYFPVWLLTLLVLLAHAAVVPALHYFQIRTVSYLHAGISLFVVLTLLLFVYRSGKRRARPLAASIATALERGRRLQNSCQEKSAARHQQRRQEIENEALTRTQMLNQQWDLAVQEATARRDSWPKLMDEKAAQVTTRTEQFYQAQCARLGEEHAAAIQRLQAEADKRRKELAGQHEKQMAQLRSEQQSLEQTLAADWNKQVQPLFHEIRAANDAAAKQFPPWDPPLWEAWSPPEKFGNAAKFGRVEVDLNMLCEGVLQESQLVLPGPSNFTLPLVLTYPHQGSVLFETSKSGSEPVAGALNNIVLRLLSQSPAGKLSFTIIDPVKLGQNFAGVMHLADYEENLINSRIWTQTGEIEQRLAHLNEHMEKVIQMYLRNEYETIAEYNEQAGNIAEKYHFLLIADFPVNFSDTAIRRLVNIAASGARCGVYTLIHWDRRQVLPPDAVLDDLRKNSVCIACPETAFLLAGQHVPGTKIFLDPPPAPDLATEFLHQVGLSGRDANRVEVPFAQVAPAPAEVWTQDTTDELRVPIGRTGATKLQYLAIGKGTRQHALIAGKTGSGKSTLFHVVITNLALWCSPEQVEFYLVDFKKGVEFKCYAAGHLPHARVVAIESDREFGLSVLQRVDDELKRRGDMFRALGVQDIPGYKRAGGTEPVPRSLLIIDEFQEFFVEDDRISQGAAVLLDRIVRQGRAFGIHVLLGSQTLGGAYTLARTTIGQMVIRIALQCNEADAYLIMDDNNPAPRLLSRPGEGIYNDLAGALEGNSPFQAVWLPEEERESCLDQIRARADQGPKVYPAPFVFEGNAPADVRENNLLQTLLQSGPAKPPVAARLWLGAPNSIKGPTEAVFHRQSGNHLLLVGQHDEAILAILSIGLVSLAAQYPRPSVRFVFCDSTPPDSSQREFLERITGMIPQELILARGGDLVEALSRLADEMKGRADDDHVAERAATFLFVHGLQNFKKLRREDDFDFSVGDSAAEVKPAALLHDLICEGAALGIHVVASCDTFNNVNRFLARKALSEFEMRVLFQMSANDSASLIDNPKASILGLHRALFYNEHEGYLETFRPYALPPAQWIEDTARHLARAQ